jgi:putative membrane fusion protein
MYRPAAVAAFEFAGRSSVGMRARQSGRRRPEERTRAKRTQKFFARAVTVVLVAVLSYSLYAMISPGLIVRLSDSAVARSGLVEFSYPGKAIIVRDERVVITPIGGIVHFLVDDGEKVPAGAVVAEVRDTAISSSVEADALRIEGELEKFVQEAALREGRERDRLLAIRVQIALKEEELKAYVDRKDAKNTNKVHSELEQLRLREADAEAEVERIRRETEAAVADIAEAKRQSDVALGRALAVLRSHDAALMSTHIDGLEGVFSPHNPDLLLINPADHDAFPHVRAEGDLVAAGSAVFREIQNLSTNLLVFAEFPDGSVPDAGARVWVRFPRLALEAVPSTVIDAKRRADMGEEVWALHVSLDRYATTLTNLRSENIHLITRHASGIVVPIEALATQGEATGVYVFRTGRFRFMEVEVIASNGLEAVVSGLREGDRVRLRGKMAR